MPPGTRRRGEPALRGLAESLELGAVPRERFHEHQAASPLPRAYQWADGSAYVNHVALVRKARAADMPESFWTDPLMYQGGSDDFLGPCDDIVAASTDWGIDFEAEVAVITGDIGMGSSPEAISCRVTATAYRSANASYTGRWTVPMNGSR